MSFEHEAKRKRAEVKPRDSLVERGKAGWPTHLRNDVPANTLLRELSAHHGAHGNAKIEWWYINAHLSNDVSFFAAFFRLAMSEHIISKTNASCPQASADRLHKVMWAVTDKRTKSYYTVGHCDRKSCDVLLQLIEGGSASGLVQQEPFASGALRESLRDGEMPLPDEVRDGAMSVHPQQNILQLDFDGNTFAWDEASKSFHLKLSGKAHCQANPSLRPDITVDVTVRPSKPPILHGRDGVVSMGEGDATNDMYYYLFPRCDASGSFTRDGATEAVTGRAWVDHEFGGSIAENIAEMRVGLQAAAEDRGVQVGWQWAAVILDNDVEVSLTLLSDSEVTQRFAIIREGTRAAYRVDNIEFGVVEGASWMSPSTARPFPTRWTARIVHPDDGTVSELRFVAVVEDQEFVTIVAKPSFWEGHVTCTGTWRSDATVAGDAYMEVHAQASKQSNDLETYYTLMHTLLVVPAVTALESTKPASKDAAVAIVTGQVEMFSMMVAMQSKSVTPPAGKRALAVTLAAIYWNRAHPEDRAVTTQWVEHVWTTEVKPKMPNDLKRIMLRAWMLKELAASAGDITESSAASEPTPAAAAAIGDDLPFVIPPVTELSKPSPTAFIDTARQLFTCNCKMDRANSGSINVMLGAQGAPLVIRQLADRVVPTLELSVTATGFVTNIKTVVSNHNQVANLDGTTTSWFSVGRGNLVTQACLLDGGRTLYSRTPVPPEAGSVGIEHKWLRAIPASAANEPRNVAGTGSILERYRYDPSGVEGADSITLQRIFRVVA